MIPLNNEDEDVYIEVNFQEKGDSAYHVAVLNGFVGTQLEWLYSLKADSVEASLVAIAAANLANDKAALAQTKADLADAKATLADAKATLAQTKADLADTAANNASTKAGLADAAAILANAKAALADAKAALADAAANNANAKAALADAAANNANVKAGLADAATIAANAAAIVANNAKGWSPVLVEEDDGARKVLKLQSWVGGTGPQLTTNVGEYIGTAGFVALKANAADFRGAQGLAGISRVPVWGAQIYAANTSVWDFGKYWTSNAATTAAERPGTSPKWVEDLNAYVSKIVDFVDFVGNKVVTLTDQNKLLRGNSTLDLALTLPENSVEALPIGFEIEVKQQGAGKIAVAGASGVVIIESPDGKKSTETRFSRFRVIKEGINTWGVDGRITFDSYLNFMAQVISDGGIFSKNLIANELNQMSSAFRLRTSVLLVCGAYKSGFIYGYNQFTGAVVPFIFTRAGSATYYDEAGIVQTAASGIPRIEYDPTTLALRGYLLERASTNLISSHNPNNTTYWSENISGTGTLSHVYNSIVAPDGTMTATAFNLILMEEQQLMITLN